MQNELKHCLHNTLDINVSLLKISVQDKNGPCQFTYPEAVNVATGNVDQEAEIEVAECTILQLIPYTRSQSK